MKKFFFPLVALACLSFISCGDDNETPSSKKMQVSMTPSEYLIVIPGVTPALSDAARTAVISSRNNAKNYLQTLDYTTAEVAKTNMHNAVMSELSKLSNDIRYELKNKHFDLECVCTNVTPNITDIVNTRDLSAETPIVICQIDSIVTQSIVYDTFCKATRDTLYNVVADVRSILVNDTVHALENETVNGVGEKVVKVAKARYPYFNQFPEYSTTSKYSIIMSVYYKKSGTPMQVPVNLMLKDF